MTAVPVVAPIALAFGLAGLCAAGVLVATVVRSLLDGVDRAYPHGD